MWPVPAHATTVAASDSSSSDFFLKDGRKIHVGDCALFKPPHDSPPFIGIIRKLTSGTEDSLNLDVNWLYRPADVKLGKGVSVEAAPNEVFYSFHKDEIPAASLLHPCKVAFLHKGVELPSGISSFVCRRVYDIENRCLWWLTDKDYINERQEEVDQLLDKTQLEMHGAAQSGGRSPKPLNGPTSSPQLKPGLDSVQNSPSYPSQLKGKKRERGEQGTESVKRERLLKTEDGDSSQCRSDNTLKSEIAKITDKGGLVDFEGVEKLVQLMQPDSADKKIDLAGRMMLVDVIAVTDRFDCLGWFVQLRGLPVLDEWLQEVHKGKLGDSSSPKESEKPVEEFLLALLRALDKLPVNLHALQTCNVGKSVNHLRTHKNSEIQKKARSLVDTWKKRVEAEMNKNEAKFGSTRGVSWPTKPAPSEVSHVGNRKSGGLAEVGLKSPASQPSVSRNSQIKVGTGETAVKSSAAPGAMKALPTGSGGNSRDQNMRVLAGAAASDVPLTPIKEERSSSSSQSQNNSQSCSSDHAKTVGSSYKEDARSSTAGSVSANKISSGVSRHRKSSNGLHGSAISGVHKESGSGKVGYSNKNLTSERSSPTVVAHEKVSDVPTVDHGNNQRLIVRLPNTGRSPSRAASGGSFEDPAVVFSRASPSAEKHDNHDKKFKGKSDGLRSNAVTSLNSDGCIVKNELPASDDVKMLSVGDERLRTGDDGEKMTEVSRMNGSPIVILRSGKPYEASLSSMNALIESCVKFSEASASASPGDDVGMNLLATVAAGEMSKSGNVSPSGSPHRNSPVPDEFCLGDDGKLRHMVEKAAQNEGQPSDASGCVATIEKDSTVDSLQAKNDLAPLPAIMSTSMVVDDKVTSFGFEEKVGECAEPLKSSENLKQIIDGSCSRSDVKPCEPTAADSSLTVSSFHAKGDACTGAETAGQKNEDRKFDADRARNGTAIDAKVKVKTPLFDEDKKVNQADERIVEDGAGGLSETAAMSTKVEKELNDKSLCSSLEMGNNNRNALDKVSSSGIVTEQKAYVNPDIHQGSMEARSEDVVLNSGFGMTGECKAEKVDNMKAQGQIELGEGQKADISSLSDRHHDCTLKNSTGNETGDCSAASILPVEEAVMHAQDIERGDNSGVPRKDESHGAEDQIASSDSASVSASGSGVAVKLDFDLNEGFPVDDGNQGEPHITAVPVTSSAVQLPCSLSFPISSMPGNFPSSITVAAAAKGPFVPPENPMRPGGAHGWKGSAATSAFRPAEPRKNLDMLLNPSEASGVDAAANKQGRPPLDFDLNVADERVLDDISQSPAEPKCSESGSRDRGVGLDLDLNRVDDSPDVGSFSLTVTNSSRFEIPTFPSQSSLSGGLSNGAANASRDFDLNNGPGLDELGTETAPRSQHIKSSVQFQSPVLGVRMNGSEFGNFSSWFPQGNSYAGISIPSMFPGRGEQSYVTAGSQRILGPPSGSSPFGHEMYRGPVLSSSPATAFQYPAFPFETTFPLSSNSFSGGSTAYMDSSSGGALCFPTIPSQLVGPGGVVSSPYPHHRPFVMSLPSGASNVGSESRKWGSQGLDLNAGPGGTDTDRRDERLPSLMRQLPVPGLQNLAEEQLKMYQVAGGVPKRKEPDGGWDSSDRLGYKQTSWQ